MKMKKIFAGALACGMLLSGVSAFAAEVDNDTYDDTDNTVSVTTDLSNYAGEQMTVIVIPASAYGKSTIEDGDILYIDQDEASTAGKIFQDMGILGTSLAAGDYYIKIGGQDITTEDDIIVEKFTVGSSGRTIQLGECDGNTASVDGGDALAVLRHFAGTDLLTGDNLIAAECDGSTASIDGGDALAILRHFAGVITLGTITVTD